MDAPLTKKCGGNHTSTNGSPFPKNAVPINLFKQDPNDLNSKDCKSCWYCRKYDRIRGQKKREKMKKEGNAQKSLVMENKTCFGYCQSKYHNGAGNSAYPRDKTPIDLFRKEPGNVKSTIYVSCLDCRNYEKGMGIKRKETIKSKALADGKSLCCSCLCELTSTNVTLNGDGMSSRSCKKCRMASIRRQKNLILEYNRIKLNLIEKYKVSCQKCKCLYIKPSEDNNLYSMPIATYERDGKRYTTCNGKELIVTEFLKLYSQYLELRVIELDHMDEIEQRNMEMLLPEQTYVPKKMAVSQLKGVEGMRLEALKCQHLCMKCHTEETINREAGVARTDRPIHVREKLDYTNSLKGLTGRVSCGYKNPNLLRFFDLDHLDRESKSETVGIMVYSSSYSLNDVIEECEKCRVLCKHCHRIHTDNQLKQSVK